MINDEASNDIIKKYLGHNSKVLKDVYKYVFNSSLESELEEDNIKNLTNEIMIMEARISDVNVDNN